MAYPAKPVISTSYTAREQALGDGTLPGTEMDIDFAALAAASEELNDFVRGLSRSDGKLANGIVTRESLSGEILIGFDAPTTWVTGADYGLQATVFEGAAFYICTIAHTSGVFADDLSAGRWAELFDLSGTGTLIAAANLSDVDNAETARGNLGLTIGSAVQAFNTRLASISTSAAAGRTALGLTIGTDVQAYDANLPVWPAAVSAAEVGHLDGVTSPIQMQIDATAALDEDDFASNSATRPPSQQSVTAYGDARWRWSESPVVNLSGQSAVTLTGIPSWARDVELVIIRASAAAPVDLLVQVRVSGSDVTTGYYSQSATDDRQNGLLVGMVIEASNLSSLDVSGAMVFRKVPGINEWTTSHSVGFAAGGGHVVTAGAIDGLTIIASGTTFDNGRAYIRWRR